MKTDDGGPAFPSFRNEFPDGYAFPHGPIQGGMSLRDWLAGQALAWVLDYHEHETCGYEWITPATDAYAIADAMLAARSAGQ